MKRYLHLTLLLIFIVFFTAFGQTDSQALNQKEKRIALVIGNGNYLSSILANSENDARTMKVALQNVGFTVMEYENLNQSQMKKAIDDFGMKLENNEVGLFFYAGHGIQSKGYNYLIPVDAQLQSEQQVEYDCVQADRVLALMEASGTKVNIIILDACRNNPFERSWTRSATGRGLAFMNAPGGTLIAYATSPGSTASDGSGNNGLYTSAILESIKIPDITILEMFQNVRGIVSQKSGKQQIPWESTSLTGNFYFKQSMGTEGDIKTSKPDTKEPIITKASNKSYGFNESKNDWKLESLGANVYTQTIKTYHLPDSLNLLFSEKSIFDENGYIKEKIQVVSKKDTTRVIYMRNNNKITSDEKFNSKGELISKTTYNWISENIYTYDNKLQNGLVYSKDTMYLANGRKIKYIHSGIATTVPNQKSEGRTITKIDTLHYTVKTLFAYDKYGTLIIRENKFISLNSGENYNNTFEYLEFDKNGNWTLRKVYSTSKSFPSPILMTIETAEYEYY